MSANKWPARLATPPRHTVTAVMDSDGAMTADPTRWEPLRSWTRLLEGRIWLTKIVRNGVTQEGVLRLELGSMPPQVRGRAVYEAVELVLLALWLDGSAWKHVLGGMCTDRSDLLHNGLYHHEELAPRLVVHHDGWQRARAEDMAFMTALLGGMAFPGCSWKYKRMRRWLLRGFGSKWNATALIVHVPTTIHLVVDFQHASDRHQFEVRFLLWLSALVRKARKRQALQLSGDGVFMCRLRSLELDLTGFTWPPRAVGALAELLRSGFPIDLLKLGHLQPDNGKDHAYLSLLSCVTNAPVGAMIHKLVLHESMANLDMAMFSMLRSARGLKSLEIQADLHSLNVMHLAWALLDQRSPSSVVSLILHGGTLRLDDIHGMLQVLEATARTEVMKSEGEQTRVVGGNSLGGQNRRGVQHLDWGSCDFNHIPTHDLRRLFTVIGHDLVSITLTVGANGRGRDLLGAICGACPKLETLCTTHYPIDSLIDEYTSGNCRLKTLRLKGWGMDPACLLRLVEAANSVSSPVHSYLRNLEVDTPMDEQTVCSLISLLKSNTTLRLMRFPTSIAVKATYKNEMRALCNSPLPGQYAALRLSCKVAFVSVLQFNQRVIADSGIGACLVPEICSNIFAFARNIVYRTIECL